MIKSSSFAVPVYVRRIELLNSKYVLDEMEQLLTYGDRQIRIPERARDDQSAESKEGGRGFEHFIVLALGEIRVPERPEEHLEWPSERSPPDQ